MDTTLIITLIISSGLLGSVTTFALTKKEKNDDKKELVCDRHTTSITDLHVRLTVVENKIDTHDTEITDLKAVLKDIQTDIKTLLQRL